MSLTITSIKFKRGTKTDLEAMLNGVNRPLRGEPIWEIDTNKLKVGDGSADYAALPYLTGGDSDETALVLIGYYADNAFYKDTEHVNVYPCYTSRLYYDASTTYIYYFTSDDGKYHQLVQQVQVDSGLPGLVKMYGSTGQSADGTMTQKAITDALAKKIEAEVSSGESDATLVLKGDITFA